MLPSIHDILLHHPVFHSTMGPVSPGGRIRAAVPALPSSVLVVIAAFAMGAVSSKTPLLPYIPTTVLIPGSTPGTGNSSTAYIFSPAGNSVDLLSLNLSSTLASASASGAVSTLTSGLPFVPSSSSSNTTTFTPTLASDGSIIVFAGDCSSDSGSSVWIYNTTSSPASWKQHRVTSSDGTPGPYFLGGSIAFSETISPSVSTPQIYSYGGQCPNTTLDGTTWINAADYSNTMVQLTQSADGYEAETLALTSPPIAEAGFSLTYLLPSTSTISGSVKQDLNSVVLGGHTQGAFVNMSTAAVWGLPEASWSFISISGPSSAPSAETNELAKNDEDVVQVQSRSGHTSILNEDGTRLVILGGWVGNTSQAAEPQLAVLEMNENEYGEWMWSVPDEQPLANSNGIYGHGAALLPGNVMMVAGGYAISSSASSFASRLGRRDGISVAGGQLQMFFNITSLTWADSYTNPSTTSPSSESGHTSSSNSTRLGLKLGLGLGIPLLLIVLAIALFCVRRSRRHRHHNRDDHVRDLTAGSAFITSEEMFEAEHEREYPWGPRGAIQWYNHYTGGHDPYMREDQYENLRGQRGYGGEGDSSQPPFGSRGSMRRKAVPGVAKGLYQPAGMDDSRAMAVVSPILEDEEDEQSMHGAISPDKEMEGDEDDPFVTPRGSSLLETPPRGLLHPNTGERSTIILVAPSPSPTPTTPPESHTPTRPVQPQHPEVQGWVLDVDASDVLMNQRLQPNVSTIRTFGRGSPTRRQSVRFTDDDLSPGARTQSDLSDRSAFSFLPNRADSFRVAAALTPPRHNADSDPDKRGGTSHSDKSSSSNTNSSYATAKSIPALQQEGPPLLLLGRPRAISAIEAVADEDWDAYGSGEPGGGGSPSKSKAPRRSWFGSLRRVFSSSGGHGSSSDGGSGGVSLRTESPAHGESSDYDLGSLGLGGVAAGLLQKRKQGRSAWAAHGPGAGEEGWGEEEWDIERAVEQRLVQVMFSVPKERLRIVNGEPDIISIEESVVVVDPETDYDEEEAAAVALSPVREEESALEKGKGKEKERERAEGTLASASAGSDYPNHQLPQVSGNQQRRDEGDWVSAARDKGKQRESMEDDASAKERQREPERRPLLLLTVPHAPASDASDTPRRSFSPGVPMTAEAVRYEKLAAPPPRARSKVQEMIDSLEQRSRSSSPVKDGPSLSRAS